MVAPQALVLAGHGSHHDPRSADPIYAHADRLREQGRFDAVRAAFWKEQPSLAEVLATVEAATTYVVPVMTSEGYFTDRVFPRELGLADGPPAVDDVRYTAPVGTHERLVDVVLDRVSGVLDDAVEESSVGLALVGHGTERHGASGTATARQAARLRALDRFAAVEALFLDQPPNVRDLATVFGGDDVVVVPLFVADGGHVRRDIPRALGLPTDGDPFGGPQAADGARVWYTPAVGTAPALTDVILERAAEAGAEIPPPIEGRRAGGSTAERAFLRWLGQGSAHPAAGSDAATRRWGQVAITVTGAPAPAEPADGRYAIRHWADCDRAADDLDSLPSPAAIRTRTGVDGTGNHRPLRTARTLPRGWVADGLDGAALVRAVRAIYPASIDQWHRARHEAVDVTHLDAVVERQAGRYRELDGVDAGTLGATIEACCGDCVRRRAWSADGLDPAPTSGDIPCPEPCSVLLEAARSFAQEDLSRGSADQAIDPSVPAAAFDRPGNRYRVRARRALEQREPTEAPRHPTP